ncbi:MAG: glutamate--tRNA ligase [Fidelibacterota bacterium]
MNENKKSVRVRFAPSPTGHLHIGGVRTALFNYLYARQQNGEFCLRIEDTDKERSTRENMREILDALDWLGLSPDEKPVIQSEHKVTHLVAAEKLLKNGRAYRCFCTKEELDADKEDAKAAHEPYRYSGRCRDLTKTAIRKKLDAGLPHTLRFRVPEGVTRFKDMVYKDISVNNREIDDFVILRSDGTPVYQLSVVVDDISMGITHVIRGEDHLSNTPKQILLYLALGEKVPRFAHLPLILAEDGKRLSKRHGASSVNEFREMGFLPEGLLNGLALLGWGDNMPKPVFTLDELIEKFSLNRVNKKAAVFDINKLTWINGQHLSRTNAADVWKFVRPLWHEKGWIKTDFPDTEGVRYVDLLKSRMRLLTDFITYGAYLFHDPDDYDAKALARYSRSPGTQAFLNGLLDEFQLCTPFTADNAECCLRRSAEEQHTTAATLIHPLRLAVTGFAVSPDIFSICEILGKKTVCRRVEKLTGVLSGS